VTPAHFTAEDVKASFLAVCLFPAFLVFPGYGIAKVFDLFDFGRRTLAFRMVASVPLSMAITPILTYLLGRVSGTAVWVMYAAFALYFLASIVPDLRRGRWHPTPLSRETLIFMGIAVVWLVIAILSLVDLQFGNKNYYSTLAMDYSLRTSFVQSISATGIPPNNPFFSPGQVYPLRYHYFWLLLCSLIDQLGGSAINPRQAMIGGTFWCGLGLMATVALYCRIFSFQRERSSFHRRARIGILLLAVTGLDLIPIIALQVLLGIGFACMDWWNEQVVGFVSSILWEPHYVCGLIACLTGFLILWDAPRQATWRGRTQYSIAGGAALATAVGASIYITLVFGIFLLAWTGVTVWKKWRTETGVLIIAGLVTILLSAPYLVNLRGGGGDPAGGSILQFHIRSFKMAEMTMQARGSGPVWIAVINAIFLPLNYFLELGFFFVVARLWWKKRLARGRAWERRDLALGLMVATSVVICTFIRSAIIGNNDLGWRGFLVAQFGLVLCAVDVLTDIDVSAFQLRKGYLSILLAIGACGTLYDVAVLRFYPVLADQGKVTMTGWLGPDRKLGNRTYALRQAYEWIDQTSNPAELVQFDPHNIIEDIPAMFYANRPSLAGDENCLVTFGGDASVCREIIHKLNRIYPTSAKSAVGSIAEACESLPLNILLVKDTDPAWRSPGSWVWNEKPVYANEYARVFRCSNHSSRAGLPGREP